MATILGIDLGTSSVKAMLLNQEKGVIGIKSQKYNVDIPKVLFAEQDPHLWWESTKYIIKELKEKYSKEFAQIEVIGFSGQMHGLVLTDQQGNPLRPAILWLDQRSNKQLEQIEAQISWEEMGETFSNRIFTGFAFPSLLWIKENEAEILNNTYALMQPKDYIRFKMTGTFGTEVTDASATTIFNTKKREWAWNMIERFGLPPDIFLPCHESTEIAGTVTKYCAKETGLREGIPVIYGAGDQQAQSIGNGVFEEGTIISNIGTGGQISAYIGKPVYDKQLRTHTFCHAINKGYTIYGATLCSGMSLNWLKDKLLNIEEFSVLSQMAEKVSPGSNGLLYLPYLTGERTPHMNANAKGMFFGLTLSHDKNHFVRAVMEGVAFSLKDALSVMEELGIWGDTIIASGGGAMSEEWLQIQADILEKEVKVCQVGEQACLGACILAGVGIGLFKDIKTACNQFVSFQEKRYIPKKENTQIYRLAYEKYKQLYQNNCQLM